MKLSAALRWVNCTLSTPARIARYIRDVLAKDLDVPQMMWAELCFGGGKDEPFAVVSGRASGVGDSACAIWCAEH